MNTLDFNVKPTREQLEAYVGSVAWLALEGATQARNAQVQILCARSPGQLATAIAEYEKRLAVSAAGWLKLVEQVGKWA